MSCAIFAGACQWEGALGAGGAWPGRGGELWAGSTNQELAVFPLEPVEALRGVSSGVSAGRARREGRVAQEARPLEVRLVSVLHREPRGSRGASEGRWRWDGVGDGVGDGAAHEIHGGSRRIAVLSLAQDGGGCRRKGPKSRAVVPAGAHESWCPEVCRRRRPETRLEIVAPRVLGAEEASHSG